MTSDSLKKSAIFAAILVVLSILVWEISLRRSGVDHAFDDGGALWSFHRNRVYLPAEEATVFIGSSRIKFDLDIPTWESVTGEKAIQLACVGSSPLPVLYDLADDPEFRGKLIIDVTEGLFFSTAPNSSETPNKNIAHYKEITPAQRAGFEINKPLESTFVFLDKEHYSINGLLDKLRIKSRPGVFVFPVFPRDFDRVHFDRQSYMTEAFVADTTQHNEVKAIWAFFASQRRSPPISGAALDSMILKVKESTDKINARGGKILFVRTPSSGPFMAGELKAFPRDKYWDPLLKTTQIPGIHFLDDPATDHYICPEFSHLTPADAIHYTKQFIRILHDEHGWKFSNMSSI